MEGMVARQKSAFVVAAALGLILVQAAIAGGPPPNPVGDGDTQNIINEGYLDSLLLTDPSYPLGQNLDIGALGGGIQGSASTKRVTVVPQSDGSPNGGELRGTVTGVFTITNMDDRNADGFLDAFDLDEIFDVASQLIQYDINHNPMPAPPGPPSQTFTPDSGTAPWGAPASLNFPPTAGGAGSAWALYACNAAGTGPGTQLCPAGTFPATGANMASIVNRRVEYTFDVSFAIPETPGLVPDEEAVYIISALVGFTSYAPGGSVAFGRTPAYDIPIGVLEANSDLFAPQVNTGIFFPGSEANIPVANLLTSVEIVVVPEPASIALLGLGVIGICRRRRR